MEDKYALEPLWDFSHLGSGRDVSPADLAAILTFTQAYSATLWNRYVSAKGRHLMLMDDSDWPNQAGGEHQTLPWYPDNLPAEDEFAEQLAKQVPFVPSDKIYFFWGKYTGVETTWELFLRYWPRFFFDDEGPILVVPSSMTAIVFCLESYRIVQRAPDPLPPPTFEALVRNLDHEQPRIRISAAEIIAERGDKRAIPILIEHLSDTQYFVAREIAYALAQLDGEQAIRLFSASLQDTDEKTQRIALAGLVKVGTEQALTVLKAVPSPTPEIQKAIANLENQLAP